MDNIKIVKDIANQDILDCLDSIHNKILKDKIAEKITEREMMAFVKVKDFIKNNL